jgi:hypothetical protein
MSTNQTEEFQNYFHLWRWEGASVEHPSGIHCDDYVLYETPAVEKLLKEKAQSYGHQLASVSAYIRAFQELKRSGVIKPVRTSDPLKVSEPIVTPESYSRMSASEVRRRYAQEPEFRAQMDHLLATGQV